jgi:mRNA interferase RelE/StbE
MCAWKGYLRYPLRKRFFCTATSSLTDALAEWKKLDAFVREIFKKKLAERLQHPRVPAAKLSGHKDRFKIKLRETGYRLVYEVCDGMLLIVVIAVGKRDRNAVYKAAARL